MYREHMIGIAVPAYNEEMLVGETLRSLPDYVDRIYICNDGSKDRTKEIIERRMVEDSRICLIDHRENTGVGRAIIDCYKRALEDEMDVVAVMAGDNQMEPKYLPDLIDPILEGETDYTKGNRLYRKDALIGMSKWRIFGNSILTILTKIASGYWHIADPQNGYTAISRRALNGVNLDSIFTWYGYCNDLLVKLNTFGFRTLDVQIPARYGNERSKIKYGGYIIRVSWLLLRDFFWRLKVKYVARNFHPLVFFYILGILATVLGGAGIIWSLIHKFILHGDLFIRITLSLLIVIVGTQFLLFAMFFDMQVNEGERREKKDGYA